MTATATGGRQLLAGGSLLAGAMLVANAGNYALNLLLGRWLPPAGFADANLMVTLMLLVTAVALSLQLVAARYAGVAVAAGRPGDADPVVRRLERWALALGLLAGGALAGWAPALSDLFRTESVWPFAILGAGMPFYLVQAVGRGLLQGRLRFGALASTYVVEMAVRLAVAVGLVAAGFGVPGATAGLTASFVATWVAVRLVREPRRAGAAGLPGVGAYARSVSVLLLGQIVVNNGDVLVAKRFLEPVDAGRYAAVALVGRAVFFLSWSVATTVFPAAAQRHAAGRGHSRLLGGGAAVVLALGGACTLGALVAGGPVLGIALGPAYTGLSGPLAAYALATTLFALANLLATVHLSTGRTRESWLLLAGGAGQTVLLLAWADSIAALVRAQVVAMAVLAAAVLASHLLVPDRTEVTR